MPYKPSPKQRDKIREELRDNKRFEVWLQSLKIERLKALRDVELEFDYPVSCFIGANGSGKSSILGAIAVLHDCVPPRSFFPKARAADRGMEGWKFSGSGRIGFQESESSLFDAEAKFSVSKKRARWDRKSFGGSWRSRGGEKEARKLADRQVTYIPIRRVIPAYEDSSISRLFQGRHKSKVAWLGRDVIEYAAYVIGGEANGYGFIEVEKGGRKSKIYTSLKQGIGEHGCPLDEGDVSQFHFGSGEASILRIIEDLCSCEENSVVLIDEVELGLHPLAARRLVHVIEHIAIKRRIQIFMTTHSQDVIGELPSYCVWSCCRGGLQRGVNDVVISGVLGGRDEIIIFVEDKLAERIVSAFLDRMVVRGDIDRDFRRVIRIHDCGGCGALLKKLRAFWELRKDGGLGVNIVVKAVLDPDVGKGRVRGGGEEKKFLESVYWMCDWSGRIPPEELLIKYAEKDTYLGQFYPDVQEKKNMDSHMKIIYLAGKAGQGVEAVRDTLIRLFLDTEGIDNAIIRRDESGKTVSFAKELAELFNHRGEDPG